MAKTDWWFKFEYLKWLTDEQLNRCSLETQGFWMRCICVMRKSDAAKIQGSMSELCRLLSVTPGEFKKCFSELSFTKTASVTQTANNFTIMSRKYAKELKLREQNRLRKQRERRHANVTDVSHDRVISKSKSKKEEEKNTHINAGAGPDFDYPFKELFEAFPEYLEGRITPAMIGFLESEVKLGDEVAWAETIKIYRMNFNVMTKSYLPDKIANILGVFKKQKAGIEAKKNGTNRNGNKQTPAELIANRPYR